MNRSFWSVLIVSLVAADQFSKWLTETLLPFQIQVEFLPFLSFYRTYNEGIAFSLLSEVGNAFLITLALAIITFILWLWRNLEAERFISGLGYALVVGGAIGNLIDRIWIGRVIDMIFFHIDAIGFRFAIFNLADTFITLGAVAIIVDEFIVWRRGTTNEKEV